MIVKCVTMSDSTFDMYSENITKMEQNITQYPTEATILAAACACIFSVVGVVGKSLFAVCLSINILFSLSSYGPHDSLRASCPMQLFEESVETLFVYSDVPLYKQCVIS